MSKDANSHEPANDHPYSILLQQMPRSCPANPHQTSRKLHNHIKNSTPKHNPPRLAIITTHHSYHKSADDGIGIGNNGKAIFSKCKHIICKPHNFNNESETPHLSALQLYVSTRHNIVATAK